MHAPTGRGLRTPAIATLGYRGNEAVTMHMGDDPPLINCKLQKGELFLRFTGQGKLSFTAVEPTDQESPSTTADLANG